MESKVTDESISMRRWDSIPESCGGAVLPDHTSYLHARSLIIHSPHETL